VEDFGTSPNSTGCRPVVSYSVTDPPNGTPARTPTRIFRIRSAVLLSLSYEGIEKMVQRLRIALSERIPRELYRLARLFNGIPLRNGCRRWSRATGNKLMRLVGILILPAFWNWSHRSDLHRNKRFTGPRLRCANGN
jgi:hypothetical protein